MGRLLMEDFKMYRNRKLFLLLVTFLSFGLSSCGNWNIKTGSSDINVSGSNLVDQTTRDVIRSEYDINGNLLDCTVGRSSRRRDLPSCNQIIIERSKNIDQRKNLELNQQKKLSDKFFKKRIFGKNIFSFSNGMKLRATSEVKYNTNTNQLIVNTEIIRLAGNMDEFKSIFIDKKAKIFISFLDKNKFELMQPLILPLNIYDGQSEGLNYRKKGSKNIDELLGMNITARKEMKNLDEFTRIKKIELSIKL